MIEVARNDAVGGDALRDLAPDLTPMLDILFILLVFFMLTAGAVLQSIELKLPASVSDDLSLVDEPQHIMLEIRSDGLALNGETVDGLDALRARLPGVLRASAGRGLIIASDKHVAVDRLLRVITMLESEGVRSANILMLNESKP